MKNASRALNRTLLAASAALLFAALPAFAGELALAWPRSLDEVTVGYEVEVVTQDGSIVRTIDAGERTSLVVRDLEDGVVHGFRVRPYDQFGQKAPEPSSELWSMPAPRVDAVIGPGPMPGEVTLEVLGVNFESSARVVSRREDMVVRRTQLAGPGRLVVDVAWAEGASAPAGAGDLLVVNPVRKAEKYFEVNPQVLDVDASGAVDDTDLALVEAAFGLRRRDAAFDPSLDLNGDGVIDGEDAAPVKARLLRAGSGR